MTVCQGIIFALWLALVVWWAVSAAGARYDLGARTWWRCNGLRLTIIVLVLLGLRLPVLGQSLRHMQMREMRSPSMSIAGVVLCAAGIGLAMYARVQLGRSWSLPATRKPDAGLVTGGPYAVVRHPIYAGMLLGMLGSVLGESIFWALPLVLCGGYFFVSARREERMMLEVFPEQYAAYMRRTNMLVPFVL